MSPEKADGRRLIGARNAVAIVDAAERLLERGAPLSLSAVAAEAGVSRPTLYAHYATIAEIVEAAVARSVDASAAALAAARPQDGPAAEALERMLAASWQQLGRFQALARGAVEHLPAGATHRSHEAMMAPLRQLIERGRAEGAFRDDVPAEWLLSMYFALVHGAHEHAATHRVARDRALELLVATARSVFTVARP